jgi:hypothetical protein
MQPLIRVSVIRHISGADRRWFLPCPLMLTVFALRVTS